MSRHSSLAAPCFAVNGDAAIRRTGRTADAGREPLWRRALKALVGWQVRSATRYDALALDDRTLKDIGLNRTDVAQAMARPWRRL